MVRQVEEAEVDELWSYVGSKAEPRWLWHAIDHRTGTVLAYVFGRRKDEVFLELKALLEPFGITRFYTDYWGAYELPDNLDLYLYRESAPMLRLPLPGFGTVAPLGLLGALLALSRRGWPRALLLFVAVYCGSVVAFFVLS